MFGLVLEGYFRIPNIKQKELTPSGRNEVTYSEVLDTPISTPAELAEGVGAFRAVDSMVIPKTSYVKPREKPQVLTGLVLRMRLIRGDGQLGFPEV